MKHHAGLQGIENMRGQHDLHKPCLTGMAIGAMKQRPREKHSQREGATEGKGDAKPSRAEDEAARAMQAQAELESKYSAALKQCVETGQIVSLKKVEVASACRAALGISEEAHKRVLQGMGFTLQGWAALQEEEAARVKSEAKLVELAKAEAARAKTAQVPLRATPSTRARACKSPSRVTGLHMISDSLHAA